MNKVVIIIMLLLPVVSCLIFAMDLLESIFQDVQFKDKDRVFEVLLEEGVSSR